MATSSYGPDLVADEVLRDEVVEAYPLAVAKNNRAVRRDPRPVERQHHVPLLQHRRGL